MGEERRCAKCGNPKDRGPSGRLRCLPCKAEFGRTRYHPKPKPVDKRCKKCGGERTPIGRAYRCVVCRNTVYKVWREANLEKVLTDQRAYRLKNYVVTMLNGAKRRAKTAGREFSLDVEDVVIPTHCPLLGIELHTTDQMRGGHDQSRSPSLDRLDNSIGYVKGNVWVISHRANALKRDATLEELKLIVAGLEKALSERQ